MPASKAATPRRSQKLAHSAPVGRFQRRTGFLAQARGQRQRRFHRHAHTLFRLYHAAKLSKHYRIRNSFLKFHSPVAVRPLARFGAHAA